MYTLILTLVSENGTSIASIPGFRSNGDALRAGKQWSDDIKEWLPLGNFSTYVSVDTGQPNYSEGL